jgi:hypothetical protein
MLTSYCWNRLLIYFVDTGVRDEQGTVYLEYNSVVTISG